MTGLSNWANLITLARIFQVASQQAQWSVVDCLWNIIIWIFYSDWGAGGGDHQADPRYQSQATAGLSLSLLIIIIKLGPDWPLEAFQGVCEYEKYCINKTFSDLTMRETWQLILIVAGPVLVSDSMRCEMWDESLSVYVLKLVARWQ